MGLGRTINNCQCCKLLSCFFPKSKETSNKNKIDFEPVHKVESSKLNLWQKKEYQNRPFYFKHLLKPVRKLVYNLTNVIIKVSNERRDETSNFLYYPADFIFNSHNSVRKYAILTWYIIFFISPCFQQT